MTREQGISPGTVQRIWRMHRIQPYRVEAFKFTALTGRSAAAVKGRALRGHRRTNRRMSQRARIAAS